MWNTHKEPIVEAHLRTQSLETAIFTKISDKKKVFLRILAKRGSKQFERIQSLNVYTGQNPRQHVVLIEILPNAYNNYLSQTAWVI
jgi:hypothetical protein